MEENREEMLEEQAEEKPVIEERNATLDEEEPAPAMTADEVQESILEDSGMNAFQKFCARMDDKRWELTQRIAGALLGIAAGVALFWDTLMKNDRTQRGLFSLPLIIAVVIALAVPNIIEKQGQRSVPKLRTAMVIALAMVIVVYFVVIGARTGFQFTE